MSVHEHQLILRGPTFVKLIQSENRCKTLVDSSSQSSKPNDFSGFGKAPSFLNSEPATVLCERVALYKLKGFLEIIGVLVLNLEHLSGCIFLKPL